MNQTGLNNLQNLAGGATIGTGMFAWLDSNATAITVMVTIATFIAYITLGIINTMINNRNVRHKESVRRDVIDDLIEKAEEHEKEVIIRVVHK
jgi:hypothetical protein